MMGWDGWKAWDMGEEWDGYGQTGIGGLAPARRFMPIYLARLGLWRTLCLLAELSLPGVRLPLEVAISPFYSLLFKAGAAMAAQF